MNDRLDRWMATYVTARRDGATREEAATMAGVTPETVEQHARGNHAFKNALILADGGGKGVMLTPAELTRVLEAQNTDERAAGYFGLKLEEFMAYVNADATLRVVYDTARLRGQALIARGIFDAAMAGDSTLLKFEGSSFLGMGDVQKVEISQKPLDGKEVVRRWNALLQEARMTEIKTIDGSSKTIDLLPEEVQDIAQGDL